jgi:MoxR-like ATPase
LQKGIEQNWTRDEYLAAWDQQQKKVRITSIAAEYMQASIQRNPDADSPAKLQRAMRCLLEIFIERRNIFRLSKPD